MRVLYLCPDLGIPFNGHKGASAHVRGFLRAVKLLGHDVTALVSSSECNEWSGIPIVSIPEPDVSSYLSMEKHPRVARALKHVYNNIAVEQVMKNLVKEFSPELIYERYSPFGGAGSICSRKMGIPHILEVNALLAEEGKRYRRQALQEASEFLEQTAFQATSLIVTVSRALKDSLIDSGIPAKKIIEVSNGVDEMFFSPVESSACDSLQDNIVIGFVGSLKPWHEINLIVDTFRILASDPVYHLLVVGDGPLMKPLQALKREFPGRVTLTGAIDHQEVPQYIHAMDIALAPYPKLDKFYFSPLKLLEYMALGKTIVATDVGQISTLIQHGETGWLVPADNPQLFIEAIRRLSKDRTLREKLGSKAAAEARISHSWRQRVSFIFDFYRDNFMDREWRSLEAEGVH
jgi:glycosyltransferase involved in cell wall biosynthesis